MKKNTFVNLIVFFIVLGVVGSVVFLGLPKSQQDGLYNYVTGKYQTESTEQSSNNTPNDEQTTTSSTNESNYTQTTQQQSQPQRREVKRICHVCIDGRCGVCNGSGSVACDWHDMDGNGDCTKCNNRGQIDCMTCYLKPGVCTVCDGKGYKVTYEYR